MIQIVRKASLVMMALALCCTTALAGGNAAKSKKANAFNWNPIMDAIIQVESGRDADYSDTRKGMQ